jgi:hypothetical protein
MYGGEICNMDPSAAAGYDGLGVSNAGNGLFIMYGGKIDRNTGTMSLGRGMYADNIRALANDYFPVGTQAWVDVDGDGPLPSEQLSDGTSKVYIKTSGQKLYDIDASNNPIVGTTYTWKDIDGTGNGSPLYLAKNLVLWAQ